jgi:hypothetical protein
VPRKTGTASHIVTRANLKPAHPTNSQLLADANNKLPKHQQQVEHQWQQLQQRRNQRKQNTS